MMGTARRMLAAVAIAACPVAPLAHAEPTDKYAFEVGDDNGDGIIAEDESGWCPATMGNKSGSVPDPPFDCPSLAYDAGAYVGGYN